MGSPKYLIVNADDFGQSQGVNRGVIQAHEHGIVTSASLMVRWAAAEAAAEYCRSRSNLSAGLHFDLGEWEFRDGAWVPLYEVAPSHDEKTVREEAYRQLERFRELLHNDPTHIDSHQHVHLREPMRTVLREIASHLGVPLRHYCPIRYCGLFYGQTTDGAPRHDAIRAQALVGIIRNLETGYTEICCHPARTADLKTMYGPEREMELLALCDPKVRASITVCGIKLRSFGEFNVDGFTADRTPGASAIVGEG